MAGKLSERMLSALRALPCEYTTWGGKPFTGLPDGIWSTATLEALRKRGLAYSTIGNRARVSWSLTPAGRAALAEKGER